MIASRSAWLVMLGAVAGCSSDAAGTGTTTAPPPVHTVTASVTGATWTLSTVRAAYIPASGTLFITAIDSVHVPAMEITLYVDAASAAGVYTPQSHPSMVVDFSRNDTTWDTLLGRIGSITLSAVSSTRLAGSFDVHVNPDPALHTADSTMALAVTGTFDVAIP